MKLNSNTNLNDNRKVNFWCFNFWMYAEDFSTQNKKGVLEYKIMGGKH